MKLRRAVSLDRTRRAHRARALALALVLAGPALVPSWSPLAATHQDPKALSVVDALAKASAPGGWDSVAVLKFTFAVVKDGQTQSAYRHTWDVKGGRYRIEGKGHDGKDFVVIFDVGTKQGSSWVLEPQESPAGGATPSKAGAAAAGVWTAADPAKNQKMVEYAYGRFINDSYWLLVPLKLRDAGVNLDDDGEKTEGGATYDVVRLTFDHVGLTPGDTYWLWVNRATHLVDRWEFLLEDHKEGEPRSTFLWTDWKTTGPLRLSTKKSLPDGKVSIEFPELEALTSVPSGAFEPPAR